MNHKDFGGHFLLTSICLVCLLVGLFQALAHLNILHTLPFSVFFFMSLAFILGIISNLIMFKKFILGFLLTAFFTLISSRIAALYDFYLFSTPLVMGIVILIIQYWRYAFSQLKKEHSLSLSDYQMIFLRMYVGFDLIPHFTEKILASTGPRLGDVNAFIHLGLSQPENLVLLAGLCELGGAIALGLGLFTRLGALLTALYLFIATFLGKHFSLGFIWATPGGGWEYPTMWIMLVLVFAISGGNKFSLDALLVEKFRLPKMIKKLMGQ